MDPRKGSLTMSKTSKQKSDSRVSMLKAAKARLKLKKYAKTLKERPPKVAVRTRVVVKPDLE